MIISKIKNINSYSQKIFSVLVLFLLTLVPWIEFINSNQDELDFIFNNNLLILLILYFLIIFFIYLILVFFSSLPKYSLISLISISVWILFQHNFLKSNIIVFLPNKKISTHYSSEIALILILFFIFIFLILIKNKKIFSTFFLFFLTFNLFFSIFQFASEFYSKKKVFEVSKNDNTFLVNNYKKPNIYYFIMDSMKPLDEFENYYNKNMLNFKKFYKEKEFSYFSNTINLYPDTAITLTSLFFLEEEIFVDYEKDKENEFKPGIYRTFPGLLRNQYNPELILQLNKLGYEFKWIGNEFADCSRYNYKYCLSNKKEKHIDWYLLQAFLKKTPFTQIFNKLTEIDIVQKYIQINQRGNAIGNLKKFLISNENYLKKNSTFYFVHHMHPHWPYKHDEYCKYKKYPGNTNFEGYKNSYLCVIKNIKSIIKTIDELDQDAIVIFQSDHNWEMSRISERKYGNRMQIFNLVKNNVWCSEPKTKDLNNVQIINYLIGCLKKY